MANTLLSTRIPPALRKDMEHIAKRRGYANIQELAREALREKVERTRREDLAMELKRIAGSQKGVIATRQELDELAKRYF